MGKLDKALTAEIKRGLERNRALQSVRFIARRRLLVIMLSFPVRSHRLHR